jgi:hypothetical protein
MADSFYRWPCGMFENIGGPWSVMRYRPMPCTPAGDVVITVDSKEACDRIVAALMSHNPQPSLEVAQHLASEMVSK